MKDHMNCHHGHGAHERGCGHHCKGERKPGHRRKEHISAETLAAMPLEDKLLVYLHRVAHQGKRAGGQAGQGRILHLLLKQGTIPRRQLMEHFDVRSGSLSEVLNKLEGAGLIQRLPNPEDGREQLIALTDEGRLQAERQHAQWETDRRDIFAPLTQEEKELLLALLEKITPKEEEPECSNT